MVMVRRRLLLRLLRGAALAPFVTLSIATSAPLQLTRVDGVVSRMTVDDADPAAPLSAARVARAPVVRLERPTGPGFALVDDVMFTDETGRFVFPREEFRGGWLVVLGPDGGLVAARRQVDTRFEHEGTTGFFLGHDKLVEHARLELWHRGLAPAPTCTAGTCDGGAPSDARGAWVAFSAETPPRVYAAPAHAGPVTLPPGFRGSVFVFWEAPGAPWRVTAAATVGVSDVTDAQPATGPPARR